MHHGEEVPADIRVYLEVTDTDCSNLITHSEKKPKKTENPEEEEEKLIKRKRFY